MNPAMKRRIIGGMALGLGAVAAWAVESTLVYPGGDGRLVYAADARGNTIPDFSWCGYRGGGVAIPNAPVRESLTPNASGDDKARIQAAIDRVAAMAPDANGVRGAVELASGVFRIGSGLTLKAGTVLRGAGQDPAGTTIVFTGNGGNMVTIGAGGSPIASINTSSRQSLLDAYVPVGATRLRIANPSAFAPGDQILLERPSTANWIHDIGMDNIAQRPGDPDSTQQWYAGKVDLKYERTVLAVDATTITIDAPVVMAMEDIYGGGTVVKFTPANRIKEAGVEKLRLITQYVVGTEDIDQPHAGNGVVINLAENCWVRQVTGRYFAGGTVSIEDPAIRITVEDCANLDPVSTITGGRRYSFPINGQRVLVQRCYSRKGRHDFITGYQNTGPNVYLDCFSETAYADSGPHNCWSTGILYDSIKTVDLLVQDRDYMGTGQGWAGVNHVLWNCEATIICQKAPTADNWAIGCKGTIGRDFVPRPDGIFESWGTPVATRSLYLKQLQDRLGAAAVTNVTTAAQRAGSIISLLNSLYDEATPAVPWPWIGAISNRSIDQDTSTGAIAFQVGDGQTAAGSLLVTGTSSQTAIVPNANIVFGGSGANRTVTITPAPNQTGVTTITLSVSDGALVAKRSFTLTVNSTVVGLPGTLFSGASDTGIKEDLVLENQTTATALLGAGGSDPWVDRCIVYVMQLPDLGPVANPFVTANFTFNYAAKTGTLKNNDLYGLGRRAAATVLGSDYYGKTAASDPTDATLIQQNILVNTSPLGLIATTPEANTALRNYLNAQYAAGAGAGQHVFLRLNTSAIPSGVNRATLTLSEGGVAGPPDTRPRIDFTAIPNTDTDGDGMTDLDETTTGRNPASAADLAFEFESDGTFEDWGGFANITNQSIGGGSLNGTTTSSDPHFQRSGFKFSANAVPQMVIKLSAGDTGTLQFYWGYTGSAGFAATKRKDLSYGPDANALQAVVVPLSDHLEWAGKEIVALRIDPISVADTSFQIDWIRTSNGDLDNDGIPDSDEGAGDSDGDGLLDIEDPNAVPTISGIANLTIIENTTTGILPFTIGDPETAAAQLALTKHTSNPSLVPLENIILDGSDADRIVTIAPAANQVGTAIISLIVSDGSLSATNSFTLTVRERVAIVSGALTNAATWGIPIPVADDTNTWKTGARSLSVAAGASAFHAHTLAIQANGELKTVGPGPVLSLNNLVLDGGAIVNLNNNPFRILLSGKTFTLNGGTLKSGALNNGRDLRFENGSLAGNGTIGIQNAVTTGVAPGSDVEFTSTINTTGFTGVFDVKLNGLLHLPPIPVGNASFGIVISGTGSYWNDAAVAVTTLTIAGYAFPNGTYTYANIGAAYQPYLGNNGGSITVTQGPDLYAQWAQSNSVAGSKTEDDDGDGVANIVEYALGGNPTNPADRGHVPTMATGTNWIDYVHARRNVASGVGYAVEVSDSLVSPNWTPNGVAIVGIGVLDANFNTVTNRVSTEIKTNQFIRLVIE